MNIRLVKHGGSYTDPGSCFDLPAQFLFSDMPLERDLDIEKKAFQHGGVKIGDGSLMPFSLLVSGHYQGGIETVNAWASRLLAFCAQSEPMRFYIAGNTLDGLWFLGDCFLKSRPRRPLIYSRIDEIELEFVFTSPFWQSETVHTHEFSVVSSGSVIEINADSDFDVYPVIEISTAGSNGAFSLINETDFYLTLEVNDPVFSSGDTMIADCAKSTLTKNGVSVIHRLGSNFIKLKPGLNRIKVIGQNALNLIFTYRSLRG